MAFLSCIWTSSVQYACDVALTQLSTKTYCTDTPCDKARGRSTLPVFQGATRTWSKASNLYSYALNTGRYKFLSNVWNSRSGDLIFVDWDPNGYPDGYIDHVMAVTGRANYAPRISQKSSNRSNISLETTVALAKQQGKKYTWYGLDLR